MLSIFYFKRKNKVSKVEKPTIDWLMTYFNGNVDFSENKIQFNNSYISRQYAKFDVNYLIDLFLK